MTTHDDEFEALLEESTLGSPGAQELRRRTPAAQVEVVRRITELRTRMDRGNAAERRQAETELIDLYLELGYLGPAAALAEARNPASPVEAARSTQARSTSGAAKADPKPAVTSRGNPVRVNRSEPVGDAAVASVQAVVVSHRFGGVRYALSRQHGTSADMSGAEQVPIGTPMEGTPAPRHGPWDAKHAPNSVQRLDLGSLQIPAIAGTEVRVQANPKGGVEQVVVVGSASALQLAVYAAPQTTGIWDDIRTEIAEAMRTDGVAAREVDGLYGTELVARVNTPEGLVDVRFVGVDGPRWMVRALFQGPAAVDRSQAGALSEVLEGLVVVRDSKVRPLREPLPLWLPEEMIGQGQTV